MIRQLPVSRYCRVSVDWSILAARTKHLWARTLAASAISTRVVRDLRQGKVVPTTSSKMAVELTYHSLEKRRRGNSRWKFVYKHKVA